VTLTGKQPGLRVTEKADAWGTIGKCKSEAAYRFIPIGPQIAQILRAWKLLNGGKGLVFPSDAGTPIGPANISRRVWRPLFFDPPETEGSKEVEVLPYVNPHAARHFFASLMIDMGYSVKLVQERMGHASPNITLALYGHLFRERDAKGDEARMMESQIDWGA